MQASMQRWVVVFLCRQLKKTKQQNTQIKLQQKHENTETRNEYKRDINPLSLACYSSPFHTGAFRLVTPPRVKGSFGRMNRSVKLTGSSGAIGGWPRSVSKATAACWVSGVKNLIKRAAMAGGGCKSP